MKESLKEPLHILQVLFLFLGWAAFPVITGWFEEDSQVTAFFYLFQVVFMALSIIFKLIRMKKSKSLHHFVESQWYFFIPYVLMVAEIYLYVWSIITEQYYFKMVIGTEQYGIIVIVLVHFAYSLVCFPHLCSKLEYISYLSAMVIQLWILIVETVSTIGTEKTTTSEQQVWDAIYQQYKDINIAFLALFIAGALIMMDYLNRTQEYHQKFKSDQHLLEKKNHSHSGQVPQQKKLTTQQVLLLLQVFLFVVAYDLLDFMSWFFIDNSIGQIAIISTTNALALATIVLKLLRMWRNNQFKFLLKSQLSFIIPYGMMICQIFLYAISTKVNLQLINGKENMQYQVYISTILFYFAASLVCHHQLCSKVEYYSYLITMAIQTWLVTYATINVVGTKQAASADEIAMDIIMQQVKDLNICYLALYVGGLLIIMDYLNRTQQEQENDKQRKLQIEMSNQPEREFQTII